MKCVRIKKLLLRQTLLIGCFVCIGAFASFASNNTSINQTDTAIVPRANVVSLPVSYEIWYSYTSGVEYKQYKYRDYTYVNGYNYTESVSTIKLTPLQMEFYSSAELRKVNYHFY